MTTSVLPRPAHLNHRAERYTLSVSLVLTGWFLLVVSLAAVGAFVARPGTPPIPIAIGVGAPLIAFFAWLRLSPAFRDFVLSLDCVSSRAYRHGGGRVWAFSPCTLTTSCRGYSRYRRASETWLSVSRGRG